MRATVSGSRRRANVGMNTGGTLVSIDVFRDDGVSGDVLVFGGLPLRPGMVLPADLSRVVVYDNTGAEVQAAVTALRGKFPDGSAQSLGLQFVANLNTGLDSGKTYTVRVGGPTRALDAAWVEPVYDPAYAPFGHANPKLVPGMTNLALFCVSASDAQYSCDTFVSCFPIKPESADASGATQTYFQTAAGTAGTFGAFREWARVNTFSFGQGSGTTYEFVHALFTGALRCTDSARRRSLHYQAWRMLRSQMGADANATSRIGTNNAAWTKAYGGADPSLPAGGVDEAGLPSEAHSGRYLGWVVGYWLTGWKQPWRRLAHMASAEIGASGATYNGLRNTMLPTNDGELVRFGMNRRLTPLLCAYITEATMTVPGAYGSGRDNAAISFVDQMGWVLDALDELKYTTANFGAHMDGVVGQRPTTQNTATTGPGVFPSFMSAVSTVKALHLYYNRVKNDSRIVAMVTALADHGITQMYQDGSTGLYGTPYWISAPPSSGWTSASAEEGANVGINGYNDWYYPPIWTEVFALAYAMTGNATYKTWAERCANPIQLGSDVPGPNGPFTPTLKALGEYFSGHQQSAKYYLDGGSVRPINGAHPTTVVQPPTYTS